MSAHRHTRSKQTQTEQTDTHGGRDRVSERNSRADTWARTHARTQARTHRHTFCATNRGGRARTCTQEHTHTTSQCGAMRARQSTYISHASRRERWLTCVVFSLHQFSLSLVELSFAELTGEQKARHTHTHTTHNTQHTTDPYTSGHVPYPKP